MWFIKALKEAIIGKNLYRPLEDKVETALLSEQNGVDIQPKESLDNSKNSL